MTIRGPVFRIAVMKTCVLMLALGLMGMARGEVMVIDDTRLLKGFEEEMSKMAEGAGVRKGPDLLKELKEVGGTTKWEDKGAKVRGGRYPQVSEAVFVISHAYDCGKCDKWHLGGVATAWCLREDGVMVTNYHVLDNKNAEVWAVCSRDGKAFPIVEILAANKEDDIAIFRVEGGNFKALPLGKAAEVGSAVRVVSHPNRKLFMQTSGEVSRYFRVSRRSSKGPVRMSITADYAKGSSGGPVFNTAGEVVGMVVSTNSIYYNKDDDGDKTNLQMVVKNTVPVSALRAMLK